MNDLLNSGAPPFCQILVLSKTVKSLDLSKRNLSKMAKRGV
jgi:hypothetical protein